MTATADSQKLRTMADWPQWYSSVIRRAKSDGIWDYCNPELSEDASASAATATITASVHRELIEPTRPTANEVKASATSLLDLNHTELQLWAALKDDYYDRMNDFSEKSKAILELDDYIKSTLDHSKRTIIRNLTTPYEKLKALKQKLEPTSKQLEQSTQAAYEQAQQWSSRVELEQ